MNIQRVMILDEVHPCLQSQLLEAGLFEILDYAKAGPDEIIQRLASTNNPVHGLLCAPSSNWTRRF